MCCIWPPHCLIGEKGNNVHPEFSASYRPWLEAGGVINFVSKGSNFLTEHYSAVKADVADPNDPTTQIQTGEGSVIHTLSEKADLIGITGQALSHCVNFTITDIADNFGEDNIKKFVLLEDTSSSVPGFEQNGDEFVQRMLKRGMQVMTSDKFLA